MNIDDSVQLILHHKEAVIHRFYEHFLAAHPEARKHFEGIDLRQQAIMLTMALVTVEHHFAHSYPATEHYLHVLGHRHHQWGIPRSLFPAFGKCLLETLAEIHGADWEPQLETQWREAYERTAETMLEGYDKPYIY